jgi:hypothetical protein
MQFGWYNRAFSCVDRESLFESLDHKNASVRLRWVTSFLLLFFLSSLPYAQSSLGTISGLVLDPTGATTGSH